MSAIKAFLVVSALCFLAVSSVYGDVLRFMPEKGRRKEDLRIKQTWDWVARPSFSAEAQELPLDVEDEGPRQRKPSSSKGQPLSFASYYGDHMVLQQYKNPKVWGYADPQKIGRTVTLKVTTPDGSIRTNVTSTVVEGTSRKAIWSVLVRFSSGGGPFNISATLDEERIMISDVMVGDVWLCSGQSNMQFSMAQLNPEDLERELASAHLYSGVRLFTVKQTQSDVPQMDLMAITQRWSVASAESLNGQAWGYFSAVCWLYGRRLYESLGYPIGLIATDYGGTPVKAWSSPDALKVCAQDEDTNLNLAEGAGGDVGGPSENSVLWNAMIHPLLNMTIYGTIWYQGEADAGKNNYNCTFPAMIADWRTKFNQGSDGQTDAKFPFGFVQLAPWHNSSTLIGGFPSLRWQQTANYGYVPNPKMPNVFMAVSIDLPDFKSPYTGIHPRYKETIAERLFLGGISVAYNTRVPFQGPLPTQFYVEIDKPHAYISMELDSEETTTALRVLDHDNAFEVCCKKNNSYFCEDESPLWSPAPITSQSQDSITVSADVCGNLWIMGLRYAWRESPCTFKRCAVYSVENDLPTPPFVKNGIFGSTLEGKVSRKILYHDKK